MTGNIYYQFETLIRKILTNLSFKVESNDPPGIKEKYSPDLIIRKDKLVAYIEIKFYKSRRVSSTIILSAAGLLRTYEMENPIHRILITSSLVSNQLKEEIKSNLGVVVWDRSNLANFLSVKNGNYLEDLGQFITEAQQGIDTEDPYFDIDESTDPDPFNYFDFAYSFRAKRDRVEPQGQKLIRELNEIQSGKIASKAFEVKCEQILKYLFSQDLSLWNRQQITDDDLSRFDLICRINSADDFWKTLISSFNSRYILFEFKNYTDSLPQGQIYTTERYLFPKALRGACMLIARNGASNHAIDAAKGALRESGKLILLLDQSDLEKMLFKRDNGDSPNDYLSDKLDQFLISLSR